MRTIALLTIAAGLALVGCKKTETEAPADTPTAAAFPDRPEPGPPQAYTPPAPIVTELSNGVPVYTVHDPSLPLVSVQLTVPTGAAMDPDGKAGRAALGASMLGEGAGGRTALEQASALESLAASLRFGLRREATTLSLDVHRDRLAEALPLAADALLRPNLAEDDWNRVHKQHLTLLEASLDDNRQVAANVGRLRWWGADHPYGSPSDGTPASAESVSLDDVKTWHTSELHAGGAAFVVVGAVDSEQATSLLEEQFGTWEAQERPAIEIDGPERPTGILLVDRPGSTQTVFNVVMLGQTSDVSDERAPLDVASVIMGGSFTSRLNRRLREELGYTYGARMGLGRMQGGGVIRIGTSIRGDATADALKELVSLLESARDDGFSPAEVARGRAQVISNVVDSVETRSGLAGTLLDELIAGRSVTDLGDWIASVDTVEQEAVNVAGNALDPVGALIVLVGDRSAIEGPLKELGFEDITVVDEDGSPVE